MHLFKSASFCALALTAALLAGAATAQPGVVKIGQSVALTGTGASLPVSFQLGAKLYFDQLNAAGGVNGRKVELLTLDDAGQPATALENTRKLLEQGVTALFGYYGSGQVLAAYPAIKNKEIMMFGALAGAEELGGSLYPNVYKVRPGYSLETRAIVRHAESLGARKFAILHASDSESLAALETGEPTMGGMGVNLLLKAPLNAVNKVLASGAESVLIISDAEGSADAVRALRAQSFRGLIYVYSMAGESLLAERLGAAGVGVVVARVVPRSDNAKLPLVREFATDAKSAGLPKPNVYMLEGYIAARAFTEALRRIPANTPVTPERLRKAVESLSDVLIGGFRVHFVDTRIGSSIVELSLIDAQGRVRE